MNENDHTRILLAILRANNFFLKDFLKTFKIKIDDKELEKINSEDILFNKLYVNRGKNFIDGLVMSQNNPRFAVIIENKACGAGDQKKQIDRYINCIKTIENVSLKNIWVIYLTEDGGEPDGSSYSGSYNKDSTDIEGRLVCLNYRENILPWLKRIKHELKASMYNGIDSYIEYLEMKFQIDYISLSAKENIKQAIYRGLEINECEATVEVKYRILTSLRNKLDEKDKQDSNYEDLKSTVINLIDDIERPYWENFNKITIKYLNERIGVDPNNIDIINKLKKYGCIQIKDKNWHQYIHFELEETTFENIFFKSEEIKLGYHIEGNNECFKKVRGNFKKKRNINIKSQPPELKDWLPEAYEQILTNDNWKKLNDFQANLNL